MPYGQHVARCMCCGKQWICGDCIPSMCPDCREKGHTGGFDCKVCEQERAERLKRREKLSAEMKASKPEDVFGVGVELLTTEEHAAFHDTDFMEMNFAMSGRARRLITNHKEMTEHRHWLERNDVLVARMLDMLRNEGVMDHPSQDRAMVILLAKECARLRRQIP